jgi:hypothetical protein
VWTDRARVFGNSGVLSIGVPSSRVRFSAQLVEKAGLLPAFFFLGWSLQAPADEATAATACAFATCFPPPVARGQ